MNPTVQVMKVVLLPRFYTIKSIEYFDTKEGAVFGKLCDGCHKEIGDENPKATVTITENEKFTLCLDCQKRQHLTREERAFQ